VAGGMFPDYKNFALMSEIGFTHVQNKVPGGLAPNYPSNNAWSVQQTSLFYGGALYAPIGLGAFIQATYNGVGHSFSWDNTDIRLARLTSLFHKPLFYGFTFNNNPGVTDLWNTPPAWGYPFLPDALGGGPPAGVQLASLGGQVMGLGGYGALNISLSDLLYAEANVYQSLPNNLGHTLGAGYNPISGAIPYGRVAWQHSWASNSFELGAIGLQDHPIPSGISHQQSDTKTDIGLDSQFQLISGTHAFSLQAAYVHEWQHLPASVALGQASNMNNTLDTITLTASYLYRQKYGITETFSDLMGSADANLYGLENGGDSVNGKPNTSSFTTELDYYPWNNGGPKFFPWANAKFFVEGIVFPTYHGASSNYDGNGSSANGHDLIFTGIWLAF
ncbi:MAG TPA: hypothetical protein PLT25_05720, partial [Acidocella sp.]|nr:hypothetical protein [Acidocella sp.]